MKLHLSITRGKESQVWLEFSLACNYIKKEEHDELFQQYENIIGKLVNMSLQPEKWKY